jgi:hypothetical protein
MNSNPFVFTSSERADLYQLGSARLPDCGAAGNRAEACPPASAGGQRKQTVVNPTLPLFGERRSNPSRSSLSKQA